MDVARIMCGDAVANRLAVVLLSNKAFKRHIQELSVDILQTNCRLFLSVRLSLLKLVFVSHFSSQLGKTTYLGNDAQGMVFVRYCATGDYVVFLLTLAKHTITGEEILMKVDSLKNISCR